jgi:hypothetical protein
MFCIIFPRSWFASKRELTQIIRRKKMKKAVHVVVLLAAVLTFTGSLLVAKNAVAAQGDMVVGGGQAVSLSGGCTPDPKLGVCTLNFGLNAQNGANGATGHISMNWPDFNDHMLADVVCLQVSGNTADITGHITKQQNGAATGAFYSRVIIHVTTDPVAGDTLFAMFDNGDGCAAHANVVPVLKGNILIKGQK